MSRRTVFMIRGSVLSLGGLGLQIAALLLVTPVVLQAVGTARYGLWNIVVALLGHLAAIDLGLASATQQFMALALGRGDRERAARVFATSLFAYGFVGAIVVMVGAGSALVGMLVFTDPADGRVFALCMLIGAADLALSLPAQALAGAINSRLRNDLNALIDMLGLLVRTGLTLAAVLSGLSIEGLAAAQLATTVVVLLPARVLVFRKLFEGVSLRPRLERELLREMYGFGLWAAFVTLLRDIRFRADNIIVGGFRGLTAAAHFSFAPSLVEYYAQAIYRFTDMFNVVFVDYVARDDRENLAEKFLIATRITALLAAVGGGGLIVFGRPFLVHWLGPEFAETYPPLAILAAAMAVYLAMTPAYELMRATGNLGRYARVAALEMVAKIVLSLCLIAPFGLSGAALATALPMLGMCLFLLLRFPSEILPLSVPAYAAEILRILLPVAAVQAAIWFAIRDLVFPNLFVVILVAGAANAVLLPLAGLALLRPLEKAMLKRALGLGPRQA